MDFEEHYYLSIHIIASFSTALAGYDAALLLLCAAFNVLRQQTVASHVSLVDTGR